MVSCEEATFYLTQCGAGRWMQTKIVYSAKIYATEGQKRFIMTNDTTSEIHDGFCHGRLNRGTGVNDASP